MFSSFVRLVTTGAFLLVTTSVFAQSAPNAATYTGPRYPGGPDSLRALVYRSTRQAMPIPAGHLAVEFELLDGQQPQNFRVLPIPVSANAALIKAGTVAVAYLQARMSNWQAGIPDRQTVLSGQNPKIALVLEFSSSSIASRAYPYADQNPVLSAPVVAGRRHSRPTPIYSTPNLIGQILRQTQYPSKALREMQMGVVYVAFEVAESGIIEHPEVLGTVSPELDSETLLVVSSLPAATSPAQLHGRPVRVAYVLPFTFKIQ